MADGVIDPVKVVRSALQNAASVAALMLTTEAERTLIERAKKAGAKGWLLKPIKPNLLVSTVTRLAV